jgi:hypothetical protein
LPVMRPRIILRYLVRFGINMIDAPARERRLGDGPRFASS